MIVQVSKTDIINMIKGINLSTIDLKRLEKLKEKYPQIIKIFEFNVGNNNAIYLNDNELFQLTNKQLVEIYNDYLGGSLMIIQ